MIDTNAFRTAASIRDERHAGERTDHFDRLGGVLLYHGGELEPAAELRADLR